MQVNETGNHGENSGAQGEGVIKPPSTMTSKG